MEVIPDDRYKVPAGPSRFETKIKGSRFIASVFPADSREKAENIYLDIKKEFHNATHNCFAYRIDDNIFRYSDDGEPSGTAGKPILQVLEGNELFEIICIVTRYFGGTKLGTGGLIRAYSEATKNALENLKTGIKVYTYKRKLELRFESENLIRRLVNDFSGEIDQCVYSDHIEMSVLIPRSLTAQFDKSISDLNNFDVNLIS